MRFKILVAAGLIVPALIAALATSAAAATVPAQGGASSAFDGVLAGVPAQALIAERGEGETRSHRGRRNCKTKGARGERAGKTRDDSAEARDGERNRRHRKGRRGRRGRRGAQTGTE